MIFKWSELIIEKWANDQIKISENQNFGLPEGIELFQGTLKNWAYTKYFELTLILICRYNYKQNET